MDNTFKGIKGIKGKLRTIFSSQNLDRSFKLSQDHVKERLNKQGSIRFMFHQINPSAFVAIIYQGRKYLEPDKVGVE